jgi:LysM repeat protein
VGELVTWNRIENPSLIQVGQRIVLAPPPAVAPASPASPPPAAARVVHVVRAGDTLWDIGVRYGTSVAALAAANRLSNPSFIRVGQAIAIPGTAAAPGPAPSVATPAAPASPAATTTVHVVQRGETLWVISARYGVTIGAIVDANRLADPSFIRTGQRLTIPTAGSAPAAAPTPSTGLPPAMAALVAARSAARDLLLAAAREFGVSPAFVQAVAWHESGWQPGAVSFAGAVGLMQLMPSTADWVGDTMLHEAAAINDARWNARAGTRLLAFYLARYDGNKAKTLAAYFQGMTSVETAGILPSSQAYIGSILSLEAMFSR